MLKRSFTKITNRPPGTRVNQREHLLTYVGVRAFGDSEIRHARVERCVDPTVVEVVAGGFHRRRSSPTLVDERFERGYGILGLFVLGLALFEDSFGAFVLRRG